MPVAYGNCCTCLNPSIYNVSRSLNVDKQLKVYEMDKEQACHKRILKMMNIVEAEVKLPDAYKRKTGVVDFLKLSIGTLIH